MAKILVIDDDSISLMIVQDMLERENHTVITAMDGRKGYETFQQARPDLLICDILMPEWDGLDLIQCIRGEAPGVKVLAMTAGNPEEDWSTPENILDTAKFFQKVDGVLKKPFSKEQLMAEVGRILALP